MLPKLVMLLSKPTQVPYIPMVVYILGISLNLFHLYVFYHWYWHVAKEWGSVVKVKFGQVLRNANNRSRRDKPMVPRFQMPEEMFEGVDILDDPNRETPPPPIVATKLTWDSYENQQLRHSACMQAAGIHVNKNKNIINENRRRRSSGRIVEQEERMMVYTEEAVVEWADLSNMKDNLGKQRKYEKNEKNAGTNQRYEKNRAAQRRQKYRSKRQQEVEQPDQEPPPQVQVAKCAVEGEVREIRRGTGRKLPPTPNLPMHGELPHRMRNGGSRQIFEMENTRI